MKKYLVSFQSELDTAPLANESAEDQLNTLDQWTSWANDFNDSIVDKGAPLEQGVEIDIDGSESPAKGEVVGYSIIQANNMEEAKSMINQHPYFNGKDQGGKVRIQEMVDQQ